MSTNTITYTFKTSPDGTNYETLPSISLTGTIYGLTRYVLTTNITASDGVGYVKPYEIISSVTNTITNAVVYGAVKIYPRN